MKNRIFTFIVLAIILFVFVIIYEATFSDIVLSITAIIILWYTYETAIIARISQENQQKQKSPSVFCSVYTSKENDLYTLIDISNQSNYPVAVKLNCNFKIDSKSIEYDPAYSGKHYWNLQFDQVKQGYFSYMDLWKSAGIMTDKEYLVTKNIFKGAELDPNPELTMDIEMYCINEMGLKTYYSPMHYDYDYKRRVWIPKLTSEKPYWEYDTEPKWDKK